MQIFHILGENKTGQYKGKINEEKKLSEGKASGSYDTIL